MSRGDIMAEESGGGCIDGKSFTSFTLWKVNGKKDGSGVQYGADGKCYEFFWADASGSYKLDKDKLPHGFMFAFKHGLDEISVPSEFVSDNIYDMIDKSDWKENAETPESIKGLKKSSSVEINSFSDIATKYDNIFIGGRVPGNVVEKVLELSGIRRSTPINGEIGIACLSDQLHSIPILKQIAMWKKEGVLIEKCEELDKLRSMR